VKDILFKRMIEIWHTVIFSGATSYLPSNEHKYHAKNTLRFCCVCFKL